LISVCVIDSGDESGSVTRKEQHNITGTTYLTTTQASCQDMSCNSLILKGNYDLWYYGKYMMNPAASGPGLAGLNQQFLYGFSKKNERLCLAKPKG
jgi:hypothetical protein